jgi:hypothetical protein
MIIKITTAIISANDELLNPFCGEKSSHLLLGLPVSRLPINY